MKKSLLTVILVAALFCLSGCGLLLFGTGATAGILGYKYYDGELQVTYKASFDRTIDAVSTTFSKQNIKTTLKKREVAKGKINGERADKESISVTIQYVSIEETKVKIRIGLLGDSKESEIFEQHLSNELFN